MLNDHYTEFRKAALVSAYIVIAITVLALLGWQFDIEILKRPLYGLTSMNPITAFGCLSCSLCIVLLQKRKDNDGFRVVIYLLSAALILLGALRLAAIFNVLDFNADLWLYPDKLAKDAAMGISYHMTPNTAFDFIMLGSALALSVSRNKRGKQFANYAAFVTVLISLFTMIGYAYYVKEFYSVLWFFPMAIHTAVCFILIGIAVLFTNSRDGFMATLISGYYGGKAARFMFWFVLFVPVLLGYIRLWLYWQKPFSVELGTAMLVTSIIGVVYFATWYLSKKLNRSDQSRTEAETKLSYNLQELQIKNTEIENSRELYAKMMGEVEEYAVILLNTKGNIEQWNTGAEKIKGYRSEEVIGKHYSLFYTNEDKEKGIPERYLEEAAKEGKVSGEGWRLKKDGTLFWASIVITALHGKDNRVFGFSKFTRDLTERKQFEERLIKFNQELEEKVVERTREALVLEYKCQALIENSFDIISLRDQHDHVIYRSPSSERITGWSAAEHETVGGMAQTHPDDIESLTRANKEVIASPGKPVHIIFRTKHKDGHYIWMDGVMTNLFHNENVKAIVSNFKDVTEQKEAEARLLKSFREISDYKFALDQSSIVAITDQKGKIQFINDNFCKISGYSSGELIGQDHRIINSGYHPKAFIRELWTTIANGRIWRGEIKNKTKSGAYYWVDTTIVPFLDDEGKPFQYVAIRSDITQRKAAEEAQRELEEKVRLKTAELTGIFERITDGFIMLDTNYCVTYANKKLGEMTGRDPASLMGKLIWDEFPAALGSKTYDSFMEAMREQKFIRHIDYYQPLNLWQENHIYPSPEGLSIFVRDISEEKRAEQKIAKSERIYKTIASSIPGSVIYLLDAEYRYLLVEGDMLEKLGYSKEMLLGKKAEDVLPKGIFAEILPDLKRAFNGEFFSTQVNRLGYDIISRYVPLMDDDNKVYAAMTVGIDITELEKAHKSISELNLNLEKKVNERTEQLEFANRELESFSYSVSHDLRAPLRAVNGYAKMLEEDYLGVFDPNGIRLLSVIQQNAARMGTLIDDLLTFSRLGRKEVNKAMVNMTGIANNVLLDINKTSSNKATITVHNLHPAPADYSLMGNVITNLLSNAIKYSSKNENPLIEISSEENPGGYVYSIKDNGVGFDMQYAHKLFGVFQRLHSSEEFEGTGVGLAIVERIIAKHGGKIWAEGKPGEGATFHFSLPRQ